MATVWGRRGNEVLKGVTDTASNIAGLMDQYNQRQEFQRIQGAAPEEYGSIENTQTADSDYYGSDGTGVGPVTGAVTKKPSGYRMLGQEFAKAPTKSEQQAAKLAAQAQYLYSTGDPQKIQMALNMETAAEGLMDREYQRSLRPKQEKITDLQIAGLEDEAKLRPTKQKKLELELTTAEQEATAAKAFETWRKTRPMLDQAVGRKDAMGAANLVAGVFNAKADGFKLTDLQPDGKGGVSGRLVTPDGRQEEFTGKTAQDFVKMYGNIEDYIKSPKDYATYIEGKRSHQALEEIKKELAAGRIAAAKGAGGDRLTPAEQTIAQKYMDDYRAAKTPAERNRIEEDYSFWRASRDVKKGQLPSWMGREARAEKPPIDIKTWWEMRKEMPNPPPTMSAAMREFSSSLSGQGGGSGMAAFAAMNERLGGGDQRGGVQGLPRDTMLDFHVAVKKDAELKARFDNLVELQNKPMSQTPQRAQEIQDELVDIARQRNVLAANIEKLRGK